MIRLLCFGLVAALLTTAPAAAQTDNERDPGAALDQTIERLEIRGKTIPEALAELGNHVGVTMDLDERAIELLPWGRDTKIADLEISNTTAREAIEQMLLAIGMTYRVDSDGVHIVATAPLKRINRRATWDDLKLLKHIREEKGRAENLKKFNIQYRITSKVDAPAMLEGQFPHAGRGSLADMLEVAAGSLGWVWVPNQDHIIIRTKQAQIANQLSRRITARYSNVPLSQIIVDLADRAEVALNLEPGMMRKLPPSTAQSYTLLLHDTTIRQALEMIAAETGLEYEIQRELLSIRLSDAMREPGMVARRGSPYIGKISIPSRDGNCTYEFLLREDELPRDIVEYRRQIIDEYILKMREDMSP